jgi:hypothetical protein
MQKERTEMQAKFAGLSMSWSGESCSISFTTPGNASVTIHLKKEEIADEIHSLFMKGLNKFQANEAAAMLPPPKAEVLSQEKITDAKFDDEIPF